MKLTHKNITFSLPGFDHRIKFTDGIKSEEQNGSGSATAHSFQGFQPIKLSISLKIRYGDSDGLKTLRKLFHRTDPEGSDIPAIYELTHPDVNAWGVTKAHFIDSCSADEGGSLKEWRFSLTMVEVQSIDARKEGRAVEPEPSTPTTPTDTEIPATNEEDSETKDSQLMDQSQQLAQDTAHSLFFLCD